MPKEEDFMVFEGVISECLPCDKFTVNIKLEDGSEKQIECYRSGKMKKNKIKAILYDEVTIEVSPYDLSKGRIVKRKKK